MPVYNAERFLRNSIESVLAQTYSNWELILIDDGSTDNSGKICDEFSKNDKRVKVIHQKNGGIGAAQNAGLAKMRGEYVTFMDNDDLIHPEISARLIKNIQTYNADMSVCKWHNIGESKAQDLYNNTKNIKPNGEVIVFSNPAEKYQTIFSVLSRKIHKNGNLEYFNEANWGKLYKSELFKGIKFPTMYAQDVWVAMDLYLSEKKVVSCDDKLYFWIQHPTSVSHNEKSFKYYHEILLAAMKNFQLSLDNKIIPIRAYYQCVPHGLKHVRRSIKNQKELEQFNEDVDKINKLIKQLGFRREIICFSWWIVRKFETFIYNMTKHKQK